LGIFDAREPGTADATFQPATVAGICDLTARTGDQT